MKTLSKTILTVLAAGFLSCTLLCQNAGAIPITGTVDMSGTAFLNNTALGSATATTGYMSVTVGGIPTGSGVSGSYTGVGTGMSGPSVTMNPFSFNPFSSSVTPLWTFMSAGNTYSFDLTVLSLTQQGNNTLTLNGTGTLHITGFTDTPGTWVFTANNLSDTFSFSSSNGAVGVPDSGSAVALLGIALAGIEGVRRVLRARRS